MEGDTGPWQYDAADRGGQRQADKSETGMDWVYYDRSVLWSLVCDHAMGLAQQDRVKWQTANLNETSREFKEAKEEPNKEPSRYLSVVSSRLLG